MKILDKGAPTKNFSELERGEVFRGNNNIYVKINHCFSILDIECCFVCEGSMCNINNLIDSYSGFNAVNLSNGYLTFFDDCTKVTPLDAELHIL